MIQAGCLPFREKLGRWEVLLITSRSGRWIFPKGCLDSGLGLEDQAKQEALEEAGVEGKLVGFLGRVTQRKLDEERCIHYYALRVDTVHANWLEDTWRRRQWVAWDQVQKFVGDRQTLAILEALRTHFVT